LRLGLLVGHELSAVSAEEPRRRKFAELVADHVLGHVHRDELVPVVHGEGMAHELGQDRARPAPGLHHPLLVPAVQDLDLGEQGFLDKRALFYATSHVVSAGCYQLSVAISSAITLW